MKNKSTRGHTWEGGILPLVVTIAWILLGSVLAFMCIRVFGDNIADMGVPALVVAAGLIWYFTERRDRDKPEKHV